jgi:hypothetical protein
MAASRSKAGAVSRLRIATPPWITLLSTHARHEFLRLARGLKPSPSLRLHANFVSRRGRS